MRAGVLLAVVMAVASHGAPAQAGLKAAASA